MNPVLLHCQYLGRAPTNRHGRRALWLAVAAVVLLLIAGATTFCQTAQSAISNANQAEHGKH